MTADKGASAAQPGADDAGLAAALAAEAKALNTNVLDMVLLHWPGSATGNPCSPLHAAARRATWQYLESLVCCLREPSLRQFAGPRAAWGFDATRELPVTVRAIGVSNFSSAQLRDLVATCRVRPAVNQVECHPYLPQAALRATCAELGVALQPYTSLGRALEPPKVLYGHPEPAWPRLVADPTVRRLATEAGVPPTQLLVRWALAHGLPVIPKSSSPAHATANAAAVAQFLSQGDPALLLSPATMAALDALADPATNAAKAAGEAAVVAAGRGQLVAPGPDAVSYYAYPVHKVPCV